MSDLPTREQATGVIAYVDGWLSGVGGAAFEEVSRYLVEHNQEIADMMVADECAQP